MHGEQTFCANLWGVVLHGTNDEIMQGEKLMVNGGFKGRVKLVFLSLTLIWVIDIVFEKLTPQIGD